MRKVTLICTITEMVLALALLTLLILKWVGLGGETGFETERWALCIGVILLFVITNVCSAIEKKNKDAASHESSKDSHER